VAEFVGRGLHLGPGATFTSVSGVQVVDHYGAPEDEYKSLTAAAGVLDLNGRGRICLLGTDRTRFLHGQVTNNIQDLAVGQGCYAALVTAKGKLESDLNIYCLKDELLLDFEPGLTAKVMRRLESYIIADDVQAIDASPHYGLLSVQGPNSAEVLACAIPELPRPTAPLAITHVPRSGGTGEIYCVDHRRGRAVGFDLFVPNDALAEIAERLLRFAREAGGGPCGWRALEMARIEAGVPRFGADMDETNLAPETGIDARAISYNKGCYIGQEVIARIRTYGQVAKALRGLVLPPALLALPVRGQPLSREGREVGYFTSAIVSPAFHRPIALGYVRRECNEPGTELTWKSDQGEVAAQVVALPFALAPSS